MEARLPDASDQTTAAERDPSLFRRAGRPGAPGGRPRRSVRAAPVGGPALHHLREVLIEGRSGRRGLPRCAAGGAPVFEPSRGRLLWPGQAAAGVPGAGPRSSAREMPVTSVSSSNGLPTNSCMPAAR